MAQNQLGSESKGQLDLVGHLGVSFGQPDGIARPPATESACSELELELSLEQINSSMWALYMTSLNNFSRTGVRWMVLGALNGREARVLLFGI